MSKHKQVTVKYLNDFDEIEVDEGMVEILKMIWDQCYDTINSCEDNFGKIWIQFHYMEDFQVLVQVAHTFSIKNKKKPYLIDFLEDHCDIRINIWDDGYLIGEDDNEEYITGKNTLLTPSIRFKKELKDEFIKLWKQTFKLI